MPIDKFDKIIQQTTTSASASTGVTLYQSNSLFLRKDGSTIVVGNINMTKHKVTNQAKTVVEDDAITGGMHVIWL